MDNSPLLGHSIADNLLRSRQLVRRTPLPLRRAARILRQASGQRMMLREPSVRVRENAAEDLEERQRSWGYSKPVIVLDVLWNLAIVVVGFAVLGMSSEEKPSVPLRMWVIGYGLQCILHLVCVVSEYRRRRQADSIGVETNRDWGSGEDSISSSGSDGEDYLSQQNEVDDDYSSVAKHLEYANTMFSFIWWVIGFYWVISGGPTLINDSPLIYWLCITFLAFEVAFVLICVAIACLVGIAVCCCLPCIIAVLYVVTDQEGATKEEIDRLPKFKFQQTNDIEKVNSEIQESFSGIMIECDAESPRERAISHQDAECCICLSAYDNGADLRELPCLHHFDLACIDKWLHINATCPLCKFNLLKPSNRGDNGV